MAPKYIVLLGDGGWGTALACLLARNGHTVTLWGNFPEITEEIRRTRENKKFLPGITVPEEVTLTNDIESALSLAELVVFSTPVLYLRSIAKRAAAFLKANHSARVMCVSKGIERETLLRGSEILQQVLGLSDVGMLFGPSHAEEVARRWWLLPETRISRLLFSARS